MNKKVVVVSHREIPVSDGMKNQQYYSKGLETFFSDNYSIFPNNKSGKADPNVFLPEAEEFINEFKIDLKIGDGWGLDKIYLELNKLLDSKDQQKQRRLDAWYKKMCDYPVSEIDRSCICEDLFDDHLEKKQMTIDNRCSVWEHKDSNDAFAFYAVFPLKSANEEWPQALINAIKEKNDNPVEEILFLLHDHDLFNDRNRPFQLVKDLKSVSLLENNEGLTITLAVFQHIDNEMAFLVNEQHSPEEIFKHYSDILYEEPKIMEACANNIVCKGYQKLLKKTSANDNQ